MSDVDANAAAEAIRREHSLGAGIAPLSGGSVPVFAAGPEHVVKLFPAAERAFRDTEWAALTAVDRRLPIPTPRPVASGHQDGWWYVVMTRLPGHSLADAWDTIPDRGRHALMREAGAALAALHAIQTDAASPLAVDWPAFIDGQRAACRDRQLAKGLAPRWTDAIDAYLARWTPRPDAAPVLLHTEVMRQHLLVEQQSDGWHVSGLIDFEPAMFGAREYEWAAVGIFLTCADPALLWALLDAYGAVVDDQLPLRVMAYALLHRYSNLRWYLERLPVRCQDGDLESLAREWFGTGAA